jgi:hypothetical protein
MSQLRLPEASEQLQQDIDAATKELRRRFVGDGGRALLGPFQLQNADGFNFHPARLGQEMRAAVDDSIVPHTIGLANAAQIYKWITYKLEAAQQASPDDKFEWLCQLRDVMDKYVYWTTTFTDNISVRGSGSCCTCLHSIFAWHSC